MFNNDPTFIYTDINNRLVSFSYNTELAYIRSNLLRAGVPTKQFIEEQPSDMESIIDDITFFSSSSIIFYIDSYLSFQLSYIISKKLQTQDLFENEIIFLYKDYIFNENKNLENIKIFNVNDFSLFCTYLGGEDSEVNRNISIYRNNIVPLTYLPKVGLQISEGEANKEFKNEIKFLSDYEVPANEIVPIIIKGEKISKLLSEIKKNNTRYHFVVPIDLVTDIPLKGFNVQEFTVILDNEETQLDLSMFYKSPITINFIISSDNETSLLLNLMKVKNELENEIILGKVDFKVSKRLYVNDELLDLIEDIKKKTNLPDSSNALFNGVLMFHTGIYAPPILDGATKHIYVENDINRIQLSKLSKLISVNSSIIHSIPDTLGNVEGNELFGGELTVDDNNYSYYQEEAFSGLLFSHYLQWDGEMIQLDNNSIKELRLGSYGTQEQVSILDIKTPEDFQIFIDDVKFFGETGSFRANYQVESKIINSCRWSGPSGCQVTNLPRLIIREDESLSPCTGCQKNIGTLDNELFELKENVQMIKEAEMINRGCATCEVREYCSKCAFLPEYMSSEQYCYTRKNHAFLEDYIASSQILNFILNHSNYFKDIKLQDIKFSNTWTTHLFKREGKDKRNPQINQNIYLIHINNEVIVFNLEKYNTTKIGSAVAYVLEAFYKGYSEKEIPYFIQEDFNTDLKKATEFYNKSVETFLNIDILKKGQGMKL